jgi:hypothetical protein
MSSIACVGSESNTALTRTRCPVEDRRRALHPDRYLAALAMMGVKASSDYVLLPFHIICQEIMYVLHPFHINYRRFGCINT